MLQIDVLLNFRNAEVDCTVTPRTRKRGKEELWIIEGRETKWKRNNKYTAERKL